MYTVIIIVITSLLLLHQPDMLQNKRTPLSSASLFGYKSIVILLLENGANIETTVDDVSDVYSYNNIIFCS